MCWSTGSTGWNRGATEVMAAGTRCRIATLARRWCQTENGSKDMRNRFTIVLLSIIVHSPGAAAAGSRGQAFTRAEICELVETAMTAPWRGPGSGGLAGYSCVQRNATEGKYLLIDVAMVSADGREARLLHQGEACGRYRQYRRGRNEAVLFVGIRLTRIAPDKVWFEAGLGGLHFDAHGREDGTTGVGCGAGNEGVIEKRFGRWSEALRICR